MPQEFLFSKVLWINFRKLRFMIFDLFRILVETYLQYFNQKSPRIFNRKCFENFMNNYYVAIMPINTVSMLFAKVLRNLYQLSCSISSSSILGPWKSRTQGKLLSTNYASLQLKTKKKQGSILNSNNCVCLDLCHFLFPRWRRRRRQHIPQYFQSLP